MKNIILQEIEKYIAQNRFNILENRILRVRELNTTYVLENRILYYGVFDLSA